MKLIQWFRPPSRKRGIALIVVVGALALTTVLLIAMFSVTESEYRATQSFVAAQSAKQFADMAVSIVQAQIQNAQNDPVDSSKWKAATRTTHSTQPGVATVFSSSGAFLRAHKLYSSSNMVALPTGNPPMKNLVEGRDNSGSLLVPNDWNNAANKVYRARYVDMNEPVVRASLGAAPAARAVYFPVIDPRAAYNFAGTQVTPGWEPKYGSNTTKVEGFSYVANPAGAAPGDDAASTYTGWASGAASFAGVVAPATGVDPNTLRLPMPVEWMYVLKDGTFGALDATGKFIPAPGGAAPTTDNPIVGRMAFWTDDESCKVNVNTATEPTYSNSPYYFHDRDRLWAHYPASTGEYQRYPGHPATVALSAVLYPAHRLDAYNPEPGMTKKQIVDLKNAIYDLAPKVASGGSQAGTVPFVIDEINGFGDPAITGHVDLTNALKKRLYASVDELLFKEGGFNQATGRAASAITAPGGRLIFDHDTLERTRFFLTAHSRAPEFSIFSLPRVCMWPVADESKGPTWRTNFDNMIALCATLKNVQGGTGGNTGASTYYFRRSEPHHSTKDIDIARNSKLLTYIERQLSKLSYPKTGGGGASNFEDKYGEDNVRQLAVEIFDYIRCTNLYDGVQARWNNGDLTGVTQSSGGNFGGIYEEADKRAPNRFTYTNQRATPSWTGDDDKTGSVIKDPARTSDDTAVLPGHGTVTPAAWKTNNKVYMGFGRFITLSEIGMHFICTADGYQDPNDANAVGAAPRAGYSGTFGKKSGGGSAVRVKQDVNAQGEPGNFKPLTNSGVSNLANCNLPQDANARWWSNFPPLTGTPGLWATPNGKDVLKDYYGCDTSKAADPMNNPSHPSLHPGLYPENWNLTLAYNTPLEPDEKRVQANIDLETFCPMSGWTKFFPEFTIVLDGDFIAQIKLKSGSGPEKRLFNTSGAIALKSNNNHYEFAGMHSLGGHASPAGLISGRAGNSFGVDADGLTCKPIPDPEYDLSPSKPRDGLVNYALASNFMTVKRNESMTLTFPQNINGGVLKISIYDSHDWQHHDAVQIISVRFKDITAPTPLLPSPQGAVNNFRVFQSNVTLSYARSFQGPHWWVYNNLGCIGRMKGKPSGSWKQAEGPGTFWAEPPADVQEPDILQETRGRLHNQIAVMAPPPAGNTGRGFDLAPFASNGNNPGATGSVISTPDDESDVVRTMVPAVGDYRMIAARRDVPEAMWVPHPMWRAQELKPVNSQIRTIHSYTGHYGNAEPGYRLGVDPNDGVTPKPELALVSGAYYSPASTVLAANNYDRQPDLPGQTGWATSANSFGDFDTSISSGREGPFINKPDEGNYYAGSDTRTVSGVSTTKFYRSGYFRDASGSGNKQTDDWRNGVYMTPNRLVSSPVMFGSLPTGIWNTGGSVPSSLYAISGSFAPETAISAGTFPARPWQTLLFRAHTAKTQSGTNVAGKANHPGQLNPMDHYILDLFFMPVVEPYAISEPLSVAGRININYQMLPFTNIRRATGLHALMKGEFMTSIPSQVSVAGTNKSGVVAVKAVKGFHNTLWDTFINEKPQAAGDTTDNIYIHRPINVEETLGQFDERFKLDGSVAAVSQGPFRSASQICELYLIPSMGQGETSTALSSPSNLKKLTATTRKNQMDTFWRNNPATGDNIRERPYSNLYSRITTRSNTFRVHVRAQVIKKARSTDPAIIDPDKDAVLSEYRGSAVLERYIDPNDTSNPIPDYGALADPVNDSNAKPLDTFYKFRVLETKRFNP